jgi:ZIP family zinc transporter
MAATEVPARAAWSPARRLALLIAGGIGLHNFGEGLAIGGSAAQGQIALATLLVIGFALHNATEGFGIVAP